jgi:hypothetical protein
VIWYLVATSAVFLICFLAYRSKPEKYADLMGVSAMLALVFCIGNLLLAMYRFPDALLGFPVLDLFLAGMIYRAWMKNREWWKVVMVGSLVTQLMLHCVTIAMWKTGNLTQYGLWTYVVGINAFFVVQLLTLASVGVGHGLDNLRRWLSDRRRVPALSDARP